jgi:FSR family fosmidomycin resistance protein-like MFS transporter
MHNFIFMLIEFLDELAFGVQGAAWPQIQTDLGLSYAQIGILLSLPGLLGNMIEPFLGVLGDLWKRRALILGGGVFFVLALVFTGTSFSFGVLLAASIVFNPASGAFVSLAQASLVESEPEREEQNMARWTFAGSLGVVFGPLLLGSLAVFGFGWRPTFLLLALLTSAALAWGWKRIPSGGNAHGDFPTPAEFFGGFKSAFAALRKPNVLRWLVLLEFADLMLDVLLGFLALYFAKVAGMSDTEAAFAVAIWTGLGLLGDFLLIPLLERVKGLSYLRFSVLVELVLFPAFLLAPQVWLKLILVGLLGFFNSGWYAILQGRLYASLPGQGGTVLAVGNLVGWFGKLLPLGIGLAADVFGLQAAMWLLLAGPLALLVGLPREARA